MPTPTSLHLPDVLALAAACNDARFYVQNNYNLASHPDVLRPLVDAYHRVYRHIDEPIAIGVARDRVERLRNLRASILRLLDEVGNFKPRSRYGRDISGELIADIDETITEREGDYAAAIVRAVLALPANEAVLDAVAKAEEEPEPANEASSEASRNVLDLTARMLTRKDPTMPEVRS